MKLSEGVQGLIMVLIIIGLIAWASISVEGKLYCTGTCGDLNGDKQVNQQDKDMLIEFLLSTNPSLSRQQCANVNDDDFLDNTDYQILSNYINGTSVTLKCPTYQQTFNNHSIYGNTTNTTTNYNNNQIIVYVQNVTYRNHTVYITNGSNMSNHSCEPEIWYNSTIQHQTHYVTTTETKTPGTTKAIIIGLIITIAGLCYVIYKLTKLQTFEQKMEEKNNAITRRDTQQYPRRLRRT